MEKNPEASAPKVSRSKKNKPEAVEEKLFPANTIAVLERVFEVFFERLKQTPINIKASTPGDVVDEAQKAEFKKRSGIIDGYRGTYLNINPETTVDILKPTPGEEAIQNFSQYLNPSASRTRK